MNVLKCFKLLYSTCVTYVSIHHSGSIQLESHFISPQAQTIKMTTKIGNICEVDTLYLDIKHVFLFTKTMNFIPGVCFEGVNM